MRKWFDVDVICDDLSLGTCIDKFLLEDGAWIAKASYWLMARPSLPLIDMYALISSRPVLYHNFPLPKNHLKTCRAVAG